MTMQTNQISLTKHVLKTGIWFIAGSIVAIGFGATDPGLIMLGGAVWVWLFA